MSLTFAPSNPPTPPVPVASPEPQRGGSHSGRRLAIAIGAVVTAVLIGYVAVTLTDLMAHSTSTTVTTYERVESLDVRTDGSVTVRAGTGDVVTVTRREGRGLRRPSQSAAMTDGVLRLSGSCPVVVNQWCSVSYTVEVPKGTPVTVRADSGGVSVTGLDGKLDLDSSAGSVRVDDVGGVLRLRSSAGSVRADRIRSTTVDASSSAGSVSLSFLAAPTSVVGTSSGGSVTVVVPDDAESYRVDASSSGGSRQVDVRTDPASSRSITVSSSAGSVHVRYPG